MVRTVLFDMGGTLWPDAWPARPDDDAERVERLRAAVPALSPTEAQGVVAALTTVVTHPVGVEQQSHTLAAAALAAAAPRVDVPPSVVCAAMCLPAFGRVALFDGATDLLTELSARGVRVVLVSNVMWRDSDAHRRDLAALGVGDCVSDCVTSLDVGWRKPHAAFFDAALRAAGCTPGDCVMVGDNEANDIVPAHERGMTTIRVAIESPLPPPSGTVADHVRRSLPEVADILLRR